MNGILAGVRVLDLTGGIAGPMTATLLADQGADVVRVEPPGTPVDGPGPVVWNRGKRRIASEVRDSAQRAEFVELASRADVLLDTLPPGVAADFGIDADTVRARNERLVYASITAYGR